MGLFSFKKKSETVDFTKMPDARVVKKASLPVQGDVVDLSEQEVAKTESSEGSVMDFLNSSSSSSFSNPVTEISQVSELKHRLRSLTGQIEDNSNQIYRMMQKIELLERKIERLGG